MKCPKQINLQRHKVDEQLLMAGKKQIKTMKHTPNGLKLKGDVKIKV